MKLTLKLIFTVVAFIILILGVDTYLSVLRESEFLHAELQRKAYRIGNAMKELVADAWRRESPEAVLALIQAANQRERHLFIRWVWLDAASGDRFSPQAATDGLRQAIVGESVTMRMRSSEGTSLQLTYVKVNVGQRPGALELSEPLGLVDDFVRTSIYRKVVLASIVVAGTLGVTLLLGFWLVGWPLNRLTDKARRVGGGDLTGPIVLKSRDELSELATTLNQMCERLQESQKRAQMETEARIATIEQLRHADRLRTVGQLASGVAHELGTPLNVVAGRASLISSGRLEPDAIVESAAIIKSQAERMTGIIRQLLDFSRNKSSHPVNVDISLIVRNTTQILEPLGRRHGVDLIVTKIPEPISACIDVGKIQQVLTNIVVNAIQATQPGGKVTVQVSREQTALNSPLSTPGPFICLTVIDTGCGIPDEVKSRLFEPFVTTKPVGQGTGLGLSIADGIVREHGGWIEVDSEVGQGSQFRIYLPQGNLACTDES